MNYGLGILYYNLHKIAINIERRRVEVSFYEYSKNGKKPILLRVLVSRAQKLEEQLGLESSVEDIRIGGAISNANYVLGILGEIEITNQ